MKAQSLYLLIFSKDRACQLDSLLRSIRDNFRVGYAEIHVLFKTSSDAFGRGYDRLRRKEILPRVVWHAESSFKADLVDTIQSIPAGSWLMFLVDDDVVYKEFCDDAVFNAFGWRHLFISLNRSRDFNEKRTTTFRKTQPYLEWRWLTFGRRGPWNYPFSVDGTVFKRDLLLRLAQLLDYKAPNSFEGALDSARKRLPIVWRSRALAPLQPAVFNNPLNRVQTEGATWHADTTADFINGKYLEGFGIDNADLYTARPTQPHFPVAVRFVRDSA